MAREFKFYRKNGRLTKYGFTCGYCEVYGDFKLFYERGIYNVSGKNTYKVFDKNIRAARKFAASLGKFKSITSETPNLEPRISPEQQFIASLSTGDTYGKKG